jgi:hypothetical protein
MKWWKFDYLSPNLLFYSSKKFLKANIVGI